PSMDLNSIELSRRRDNVRSSLMPITASLVSMALIHLGTARRAACRAQEGFGLRFNEQPQGFDVFAKDVLRFGDFLASLMNRFNRGFLRRQRGRMHAQDAQQGVEAHFSGNFIAFGHSVSPLTEACLRVVAFPRLGSWIRRHYRRTLRVRNR